MCVSANDFDNGGNMAPVPVIVPSGQKGPRGMSQAIVTVFSKPCGAIRRFLVDVSTAYALAVRAGL